MALIRSIIFITMIFLKIQILLSAAGEPSLSPSTCDRYFITRLSILKFPCVLWSTITEYYETFSILQSEMLVTGLFVHEYNCPWRFES